MRYPIFFGASLSLCMIASAIFFIFISPVSFLQDPFSVVGNIPSIYPLFVTLGILLSLAMGAFLYGTFSFFNHLTTKVKGLIIVMVLSGILIVIIPYTKEQLLYGWIHTGFTVIGAVLIFLLSLTFRQIADPKEQVLTFIKQYTPSALSLGTISLFLFSGRSMLMETYFVVITSILFLVMGITMQEKKTHIEDKTLKTTLP